MFHIYYIFDGEVSQESDDCASPVDVTLSLETAFYGGKPEEEEQGWLLELQAECEKIVESTPKESGEVTVVEDDDFILTYKP